MIGKWFQLISYNILPAYEVLKGLDQLIKEVCMRY